MLLVGLESGAKQLFTAAIGKITNTKISTMQLARQGKFPVPVLRLGHAYRVRRSDLLEWFGITDRQDGSGVA